MVKDILKLLEKHTNKNYPIYIYCPKCKAFGWCDDIKLEKLTNISTEHERKHHNGLECVHVGVSYSGVFDTSTRPALYSFWVINK